MRQRPLHTAAHAQPTLWIGRISRFGRIRPILQIRRIYPTCHVLPGTLPCTGLLARLP
jgi:hypothetical protein